MENIEIKSTKKHIPVFLSADNNFSPFVATTIVSIMENTKSLVDFYVLDGGIFDINKDEIKKTISRYPNCKIEFIRVNTKKEFKDFPTRIHFTIDMYTRYLIPQLRPKLGKVIYSDVDVIFNGDIQELYKENLNNFAIGAVPYTFGYLNPNQEQILDFHKRLNLPKKHKYFESGLLLIDCNKWRNEGITNRLLKKVGECSSSQILTPDQDILNIIFENNYQKLDNKYIVVPDRVSIMLGNEETRESVRTPFIYHYAGPEKPWNNPDINFAEYFWKYARKTTFSKRLRRNLMDRIRLEKRMSAKASYVITSPKELLQKYFYEIRVIFIKFVCSILDSQMADLARKVRGQFTSRD